MCAGTRHTLEDLHFISYRKFVEDNFLAIFIMCNLINNIPFCLTVPCLLLACMGYYLHSFLLSWPLQLTTSVSWLTSQAHHSYDLDLSCDAIWPSSLLQDIHSLLSQSVLCQIIEVLGGTASFADADSARWIASLTLTVNIAANMTRNVHVLTSNCTLQVIKCQLYIRSLWLWTVQLIWPQMYMCSLAVHCSYMTPIYTCAHY